MLLYIHYLETFSIIAHCYLWYCPGFLTTFTWSTINSLTEKLISTEENVNYSFSIKINLWSAVSLWLLMVKMISSGVKPLHFVIVIMEWWKLYLTRKPCSLAELQLEKLKYCNNFQPRRGISIYPGLPGILTLSP